MSESYAARTESMASDGTASPTSRINVGSPFPGPIPSPTARSTKSRRYLTDFETALEHSSTPPDLIDRMLATYADLANPYTLWVAA